MSQKSLLWPNLSQYWCIVIPPSPTSWSVRTCVNKVQGDLFCSVQGLGRMHVQVNDLFTWIYTRQYIYRENTTGRQIQKCDPRWWSGYSVKRGANRGKAGKSKTAKTTKKKQIINQDRKDNTASKQQYLTNRVCTSESLYTVCKQRSREQSGEHLCRTMVHPGYWRLGLMVLAVLIWQFSYKLPLLLSLISKHYSPNTSLHKCVKGWSLSELFCWLQQTQGSAFPSLTFSACFFPFSSCLQGNTEERVWQSVLHSNNILFI